MGEPIEADTEASRRSEFLHLAGVVVAVANFAICILTVPLGPYTGLRMFRNGNSLGWFVTFMLLFSFMHMGLTMAYLLIRLATTSKYRRGGAITLVLAGLPWIEWVAFYNYV